MKCNAAARSKARRQDETGFSLFPFLAVLICTMGVLILLLIVIARNGRAQATEAAYAKLADEEVNLKQSREDTQWRIGHLKTSLATTQSQLADARLEVGHLEDHSRELRGQLAELEKAWRQLDSQQASPEQRQAMDDRLRQLNAQIAEAENRIGAARQTARQRAKSYAIVPYEGPNQTRRRPIYVECRANVVLMQPEGVALAPSDFEGSLGPDNPLAVARRAAREHLLRRGEVDGDKAGEPYPLLLVRPSGIEAYYAAREAMQSWGAEFGYELIGEDWKLDFPSPDPELVQTLRREVDSARQRQERLAEAAPTHYRRYRAAAGSDRPQYTVSSGRGGVVPYGDTADLDEDEPRFGKKSSGGGFGQRGGEGFGESPTGAAKGNTQTAAGNSDGPSLGQPSAAAAGEAGEAGPPRTELAKTGGSAVAPPSSPSSAASSGEPMRPGEWRPSDPRARSSRADSEPETPPKPTTLHEKSLAEKRGRNWGLPNASPRSTPLAQPIRIECYPDRLVVVAQEGRFGGKTIPLGPSTAPSIDDFVSAVWAYMETWGIAGNHMYWRPILNVYVAPGGEQRFADLDALLKDSGLDVERKEL